MTKSNKTKSRKLDLESSTIRVLVVDRSFAFVRGGWLSQPGIMDHTA